MKEENQPGKEKAQEKEKAKSPQEIKPEKRKEQQEKAKETKPAQKEAEAKGYDPWSILLYPHLGEKSMGMVEFQNRLTFIVDRKATKREIAEAMEKGFQVKVKQVNVELTRKGVKKAYITLEPQHSAADIATRLGMI